MCCCLIPSAVVFVVAAAAEEMEGKTRETQVEKEVEAGSRDERGKKKKGTAGKDRQLIKLTLWSFSGGRTIVLSMVFSTIFHSSFRTRFSTVFSQILANNIKLRREREHLSGQHLTHASQTEAAECRGDVFFVKGENEREKKTPPLIHWNKSGGFML